jgi:hypothetical protein
MVNSRIVPDRCKEISELKPIVAWPMSEHWEHVQPQLVWLKGEYGLGLRNQIDKLHGTSSYI